jgi:hypothetical protein
MSNALAPSATLLTVSTNGMENFPFDAKVKQIATMKLGKNASGRAIEKFSLNKEKLAASVIAEFRRTFPNCVVGTNRDIPSEFHARIWEAVNRFCEVQFNELLDPKLENIRKRWTFKPNFKDQRIDTELAITGTKQVDFNRQLNHCDIHIEYLQRELDRRVELNSKPSLKEPNFEKEKAISLRLEKFEALRTAILAKQADFNRATTANA